MRGAAFIPAVREPFGERFLQAALRRILVGDVEGVRAHILRPSPRCVTRRLAPAEVATVARLTKTPPNTRAHGSSPRGRLRSAVGRRPHQLARGRAGAFLPRGRRHADLAARSAGE